MSLPWNQRKFITDEIARQLAADECDPCKNGGRTVGPKVSELRYVAGVYEVYDGQKWVAVGAPPGGSPSPTPTPTPTPTPSNSLDFPLTFPIQF